MAAEFHARSASRLSETAARADYETYAGRMKPVLDPLVQALLLAQPDDAAAFCAQYFQDLTAGTAGTAAAAADGVVAAGSSTGPPAAEVGMNGPGVVPCEHVQPSASTASLLLPRVSMVRHLSVCSKPEPLLTADAELPC